LAAADGRTSPYVLPQRELDNIVQRVQRNKGLTLSHDLSTVKTTAVLENNTIVFYFEIPIIDVKKDFNLYTITPLPVFMNNGTYLPNIDSNHIAINHDGDKFTVLNDIQLIACLDKPPRCESHTAITPIRNGISCVATSYITDKQTCPLYQSTSAPLPRFYFYDEYMVFSTPETTTVYVVCTPAPGQNSRRDQTMILNGIGIQQIAPGCSLTLPDGTTHQTPSKAINVSEIGTQLFREIFQEPQPLVEAVYIDERPIFAHIPKVKPPEDTGDILEFTKKLTSNFHPATVTANTTQTIVIIIVLTALAALAYYFRHCFCRCCHRRPRIPPPDISEPVRETGQHWFQIPDDEPDTISQIAAQPDPEPPRVVRFQALRKPMQSLYSTFPAWTKSHHPQSDLMTVEQMQRRQRLERQGPIRRNTESESQTSSILRTPSLDIPRTTTGASHISQEEFERLKRDQQRVMDQHQQTQSRPEYRASYQPIPENSTSVQFHQP